MHWDSAEIRREREFGWFRQHEAEMMEEARRRRLEANRARQDAASEADRAEHRGRCPKCGDRMTGDLIEEIAVERCPSCEGMFFDRGELETLLLRHDGHRRGFFRRLLGFPGNEEHGHPTADTR
jgi:hypothetical protein